MLCHFATTFAALSPMSSRAPLTGEELNAMLSDDSKTVCDFYEGALGPSFSVALNDAIVISEGADLRVAVVRHIFVTQGSYITTLWILKY